MEAFHREYGVGELTRVGLRYVNQVKPGNGDPLDWGDLIAPALVDATIGIAGDQTRRISKSFHELRLTHEDYRMTVRFGLHNEDFPNPVAQREFILDFDCSSAGLTEAVDVPEVLRRFHRAAEVEFERSIGEGLRRDMGIIEDSRQESGGAQ